MAKVPPWSEDYIVRRPNGDPDGGASGKEDFVDGPKNRVKDGESGGSAEGPARHNGQEIEIDAQAGHEGSAPQADKVAEGLKPEDYTAYMEQKSAEHTQILRKSLGYRDLTPGAGTQPDPKVTHNQQDDPQGNYRN